MYNYMKLNFACIKNIYFKIIYFILEASNLEKKINDAFKLFDHTGSDAVDVREIGTIIRSLGNSHFQ